MSSGYRIEKDSLGDVKVPENALYGAQTQRAFENFPISGQRFGRRFIQALGLIKKAAALTNAELGKLDQTVAAAVAEAAKEVVDEGRGIGPMGRGVYLDFADAIGRLGEDTIRQRYRNLFDMYEKITGENPYSVPMRIYPASHYTMGGLWVDYNLQSTIPGLYVIGEANFSDHGANRLGASALMQGLADGYFVIADTVSHYLAGKRLEPVSVDDAEFVDAERGVRERINRLLDVDGTRSVDSFHKKLGHIMWENCGMARTEAGLRRAIGEIGELREQFWKDFGMYVGSMSQQQLRHRRL